MCVLLLQLLGGLTVCVNKGPVLISVRCVCCQTGAIVVSGVTDTSGLVRSITPAFVFKNVASDEVENVKRLLF